MADALKSIRKEKKPSSNVQCVSTIENLKKQAERHPDNDKEWQLRPIPKEYLAVPSASNLDELVGAKPRDIDQVIAHNKTRGSRNTPGDSKDYKMSPKLRDRAIHAFTYSKPYNPTNEELKKLNKLTPMDNVIAQPEVKKEVSEWHWSDWLHYIFWKDWFKRD